MFNAIVSAISTQVTKAAFFVAKNKGEILVGTGLVSCGVAMYEFHKAGMRVDKILEEGKEKMDKVEMALERDDIAYTEEDAEHDRKIAKYQTGRELVKNYILPVVFGVGGMVLIGRGVGVIHIRLEETSAALALVTKSYDAFYNRVKDKYGEEEADALKYGYEETTITETKYKEDGSSYVEVTKEKVLTDDIYSPYAVFVPENHIAYEKCVDYMKNMVGCVEFESSRQLRQSANGIMPWYPVIDALCIDDLLNPWQQAAKLVAGWKYDANCEDSENPNFVRIKCDKAVRPNGDGTFQNGYILDFNIRGNIYDETEKKAERYLASQTVIA